MPLSKHPWLSVRKLARAWRGELTRGGLEAETDVLVPALGLGGNLAA